VTEFKPSERQSICDLLVPPEAIDSSLRLDVVRLDFVALTACARHFWTKKLTRQGRGDLRRSAQSLSQGSWNHRPVCQPGGIKEPDSGGIAFCRIRRSRAPCQVRGHAFHPEDLGGQVRAVAIRLANSPTDLPPCVRQPECRPLKRGSLRSCRRRPQPTPGEAGPALRRFLTAVLSQASGQPFARAAP